MATIEIDESLCCGDALCVRVCPSRCLRMKGNKAAPVPLSENLCLHCGQCMAVCPRGAVCLDGISSSASEDVAPVAPQDAALLIRTRRSIRNFKDAPVPREVLKRALDVARYAPTGKNRQDVAWVAVDSKDALRELVRLVIDAMREIEGTQRLIGAYEKGQDPILRGAPCAIFAHASEQYELSPADCALSVGYLDLMLHSMGLGSCWAGYAIRIAQLNTAVSDFLGISEGRKVYGGLMLGYPAVHYQHIPSRKSVQITWV